MITETVQSAWDAHEKSANYVHETAPRRNDGILAVHSFIVIISILYSGVYCKSAAHAILSGNIMRQSKVMTTKGCFHSMTCCFYDHYCVQSMLMPNASFMTTTVWRACSCSNASFMTTTVCRVCSCSNASPWIAGTLQSHIMRILQPWVAIGSQR